MASDEGFREIQLNGKQLVFLFMATTIVAVVIFLCGVMVGRGVRNGTTTAAADAAAAPAPAGDLAAVPDVQAGARGAAPPASPPPPPPPAEDAPADRRGDNGKPAGSPPATSNEATAAAPAPAQKQPAPDARAQKPAAPPGAAPAPATVPVAAVPAEPAGDGFVVQVAALTEKGQAEAIARHLLDKGYAAYIVAPPAGGGMFRVRVGKFKQRREAEAVVRRLKKEEQFEPWIPPK